MTHHINKMRFGPPYPGRVNALDGFDRIVDHDYGTFKYFLTIVPTRFVASLWGATETFSYSVSEYFLPGGVHHSGSDSNTETMPSLTFRLDMSPIAVTVSYPDRAPGHFIVRLCAVLGGCFALTQWLDKLVHGIAGLLS